jgi:hypothetical protein
MNPYLEQTDAWEDFHYWYVGAMGRALERCIGPNYYVKVESRIYLHELSAKERRYFGKSDIGLSAPKETSAKAPGAVATLPAPYPLDLTNVEEWRQRYLEITDRRQRRVVTAIELLSPANKTPGPDRDDYLRKRTLILASSVSFVEIDLRRGGQRPNHPGLPPCDFYVLISRASDRPRAGMWPIALRDRLPVIPIPLTAPDSDVLLDLQALLHQVYDETGFAKYIYSDSPEPPLSAEDLAWAKSLVPAIP